MYQNYDCKFQVKQFKEALELFPRKKNQEHIYARKISQLNQR